ncbi:MAG: immune inhibitor A [Lewinellaceae bacterium]|nr:immune inhibitor A [Lewinellaceae bacterium]
MNRICIILLLACLAMPAFAQQAAPHYSRVYIDLKGKSMTTLAALGLETDHGEYFPGKSLTTDLSDREIQLLHQSGFQTKILIEDVTQWYANQKQPLLALKRGASCGSNSGVPQYSVPTNYTDGSMGGYHTLEEMLAILDDMRAKFPNLISIRAVVSDTITTHEGRSQYYVKISDNPDSDEPEPEVLYTALHHAREPNGMSQMLNYMWYLLENYATDTQVQYIVNNTELFFIPCVNPDGYKFNELNSPNGGGFWRKNRRDNQDGTFGVDLNRNYGYEWGFDDNGSSPTTSSEVYRGPSPFSEPETRMLRDFCLQHQFFLALNYHTYGNLLIYPWSYNDVQADPGFLPLANLFTRYNNYRAGTSIQTVGYQVNGNSDDWMFGGADVYAFTPEVGPGSYGFWPPQTAIQGLNQINLWTNLTTALCALQYAEAKDAEPGALDIQNPKLHVKLTRYGFQDGAIQLSVTPFSSNIIAAGDPIAIEIPQFATIDTSFQLAFAPGTVSGETAVLLLNLQIGTQVYTDTLYKRIQGPAIPLLADAGENLDNWTNLGWGISTTTFLSAPSSFTDSPDGDYSSDDYRTLESPQFTIPANAVSAALRFWAKWAIEASYDFVVVQAVASDGTETSLCGRFTTPGSTFQLLDEPVFDGFQPDWVEECMDLSAFAGQTISIRFSLLSDGFLEYDGFYFDDLAVEYTEGGVLNTASATGNPLRLRGAPNPASNSIRLFWNPTASAGAEGRVVVSDVLGRTIANQPVDPQNGTILLDTQHFSQGLYWFRLELPGRQSESCPFSIQH